MSARGVFGLIWLANGNDADFGSFLKQKSVFKESLHPNAGRSLSKVNKVPVNNFERNNKANMTTRRKELHSILRVLEICHIEKVPLACLLVVGALFTSETLDFNSEVNSRFCFFRRECRRLRRRLLRPPAPLDFFLNKVAFAAVDLVGAVNPIELVVALPSPSLDVAAASVSSDIGVRWFRREYRRRLLPPPPLDIFMDQGALAVLHMITLVVVLPDPLDMVAVISSNISVISC